MVSRMEDFYNRGSEPVRIDPNQAAADALGVWFEDRFAKLETPSRERIYALMVLLQRRYFYYRRRSSEEMREPLHSAYEMAYDRLEELLEDTDMPLPQWQEPTSQPTTEAAESLEDSISLHMDGE